ncbi:MAG: N-acetyltransferase [Cytophagaceae bacterium]|jgi:predicted GNAT family acetyltransferase|nr:N-acetyltransferase [Cytophagaceae bacterium]
MKYEVIHNTVKNRFEVELDGCMAYAEYIPTGNALNIIHTIVPPPIEGRGVASALISHAFEHAHGNCSKIIPTCSYVQAWIKRHPEYGGDVFGG